MTRPRLFPLIRFSRSDMFPVPRTTLSVPATAGFLRGFRTCQLYAGMGLIVHYDTPLHLPTPDSAAALRLAKEPLEEIPEVDRNPVREILAAMGDQMDKGLGHRTYAHHSHFCSELGTPPEDHAAAHPSGSFAVFASPEMMVMSGTYDIDLREERREVWHNLSTLWPDLSEAPELTYLRSVADLRARPETEIFSDAAPGALDDDHILPVLVRPRSGYSNHQLLRLEVEVKAFLERLAPLLPQLGEVHIERPIFDQKNYNA